MARKKKEELTRKEKIVNAIDDAMIAVEMMVRKIEEGYDKFRAATYAYTSTAFPMLTGTLRCATDRLLVNGVVASIVLFGGIGIWSALSMLLINAQGPWNRPTPGAIRSDLIGVAIALVHAQDDTRMEGAGDIAEGLDLRAR